MPLDDVTADKESDSQTRQARDRGVGAPAKRIEDRFDVVDRKTDSTVSDSQQEPVVLAHQGDRDQPALGAVFDGVIDHIRKDLLQPVFVGRHDALRILGLKRKAMRRNRVLLLIP